MNRLDRHRTPTSGPRPGWSSVHVRWIVWLTCLALLLGGAMAGWGRLAAASAGSPPDLLADWCASPTGVAEAPPASGGTEPDRSDDHALHAKVHCALCVVAADLPQPPALDVPVHQPVASAGWRATVHHPVGGRLPWQRPQPRGPPHRT